MEMSNDSTIFQIFRLCVGGEAHVTRQVPSGYTQLSPRADSVRPRYQAGLPQLAQPAVRHERARCEAGTRLSSAALCEARRPCSSPPPPPPGSPCSPPPSPRLASRLSFRRLFWGPGGSDTSTNVKGKKKHTSRQQAPPCSVTPPLKEHSVLFFSAGRAACTHSSCAVPIFISSCCLPACLWTRSLLESANCWYPQNLQPERGSCRRLGGFGLGHGRALGFREHGVEYKGFT